MKTCVYHYSFIYKTAAFLPKAAKSGKTTGKTAG